MSRLEEIEGKVNEWSYCENFNGNDRQDVRWLIHRVKELEGLAQDFKEGRDATEKENKRLMEWNKQIVKLNQRYKQALEKIRDTHFPDTNTTAHDVANEALKGDTNV